MDWNAFVDFYATQDESPIITKILRKSILEKFTDDDCVIQCENAGSKIYLDGRRAIIESLVHEFSKKSPTVVFSLPEVKKRKSKKQIEKEESAISLLQYQGRQEEKIASSGLQPRFTFETFAVSNTNQMAYAAAQAIAKSPGEMYNPYFLYGDVGVGKTHLCQAIAHGVLEKDIRKKVLYCTSEQFTNDMVEAIRSKNTKLIRDKYRNLDVLIVDDVQFIAGKNYVQEEFYHTFNSIVQRGGQIVMISDRSPQEIKKLEDRLRSRFSGGLIIDMQSPDFELRTAIVLIKARERKIDIDMHAAQKIAEKITDSRELEGALLKLLSLSLSSDESNKITLETANIELNKQEQKHQERLHPQDVIKTVAAYYELKPSHIKGNSRKQNIALARQIVMYFLRSKMGLNLEEVAFMVKRKDHTTVMHAVEKVKNLMMKDDSFKEDIQRMYGMLISR